MAGERNAVEVAVTVRSAGLGWYETIPTQRA